MAKAIKEEEAEKMRIEQDMAVLQSRLAHIKESLQKKVRATCPFGWAGPGLCKGTCMQERLAKPEAATCQPCM